MKNSLFHYSDQREAEIMSKYRNRHMTFCHVPVSLGSGKGKV